jgi:hypothetical protein
LGGIDGKTTAAGLIRDSAATSTSAETTTERA